MKPFLFIGARGETEAADKEYGALLHYGNLQPEQLVRVRGEQGPILPIKLEHYSGVIAGGSPFNWTTPADGQTEPQIRFEKELLELLEDIVARDFPFLGICYGVGALGVYLGEPPDISYGESAGPVLIELTPAGKSDPILAGIPLQFYALTAHKEALSQLPHHAVLLAYSQSAPVQMLKVKNNIYATQFHPELDITGFIERLNIYRHSGYFPPDQLEKTITKVSSKAITYPTLIIKNFIKIATSIEQ